MVGIQQREACIKLKLQLLVLRLCLNTIQQMVLTGIQKKDNLRYSEVEGFRFALLYELARRKYTCYYDKN